MSLFRKRHDEPDDAEADNLGAQVGAQPGGDDERVHPASPSAAAGGPFDVVDADDDTTRIDFGSVRVPAVDGMEVRVETGPAGDVVGVGFLVAGSVLQVQAFAAPRSEGIWDEVRADLKASLAGQGGSVEEVSGRFGTELRARVPVQRPDGSSGQENVRFVGVDGPRWFLRGVISGAGVDPAKASMVEQMFAGVVVVRGDQAAPPREPLPLTLPAGASPAEPDEPAP